MEESKPQKTVIVGAGPVGSLAALYAANRGDDVEVYELRGDLRDPDTIPLNFTRSINLALSERGINSMRQANRPSLLDAVLAETIPMHGRMIHGENQGKLLEESQLYDIHGRFIRAVDRGGLNKLILDELASLPNVKLFFNHKLVGADFRRNVAWFEVRELAPSATTKRRASGTVVDNRHATEIEVPFDFMIGADGAHSAVRYHLMKFARVSYTQRYIDTLWCEFHIEPKPTASGPDFKLHPNRLHIWPGGNFMFIAIPSLDKSFTSTLFLPSAKFADLDAHADQLIPFFKANFPGVVPELISEEDVLDQYHNNPHLPLISIKCTPYHFGSSVVILGDAAHAMVPFYGQGMNAGLEDVRVLYEHLDAHIPLSKSTSTPASKRRAARAAALAQYTETRHTDAVAICDLAYANYAEMAAHVRSPVYLLRKYVEEALSVYTPWLGWATQYSRVSFGNERYSAVQAEARRQQRVLRRVSGGMGIGVLGTAVWLGLKWWRTRSMWA